MLDGQLVQARSPQSLPPELGIDLYRWCKLSSISAAMGTLLLINIMPLVNELITNDIGSSQWRTR